jgi:hypothetical protein
MKALIRRAFLRVFKRYRRLEFRSCTYAEADALIRENAFKSERDQWVIAREDDRNLLVGACVFLERRERILQ